MYELTTSKSQNGLTEQGFSTLPLLTCRAHGSWLGRRWCTKQEPHHRPRLHPCRHQQHPSPADTAKCVLIVPGQMPMTQSICMKTQSLFCMRCDPRWVGQAQVTTVKETQTKCHYVYRRTSPVSGSGISYRIVSANSARATVKAIPSHYEPLDKSSPHAAHPRQSPVCAHDHTVSIEAGLPRGNAAPRQPFRR